MNIPNTMMRNANSRRGAMRSDAAAAFIIDGDAVVASAMMRLGTCAGLQPGDLRTTTSDGPSPGASRSASLSASAAPSRVSTVV